MVELTGTKHYDVGGLGVRRFNFSLPKKTAGLFDDPLQILDVSDSEALFAVWDLQANGMRLGSLKFENG